jgi:phosphoglycerate dehydrogenase-like enzyme
VTRHDWTVLITAPRACDALAVYREALEPRGCEVRSVPPVARHGEDELVPLLGDVDAIVCGDDCLTARVLGSAPRLRVIAKWGTGVDSIDHDAAQRHGIAVWNTPDAFSEPVADSVLGYVLLFARRLDAMTSDMREGRWLRLPLRSLRECSLGIVGFGHIGRAVARRAAAFGMPMLVHDLRPVDAEAVATGARVTDLDDLLRHADFVTLHTDLRPANRHLIDEARLALMRPSAVLVNTARGALVDEPALARALADGRLAGAALDVFEDEPLPDGSPLRQLPNVYLAPHNSNSSPSAAEHVHANTIRNVLRGLGALQS